MKRRTSRLAVDGALVVRVAAVLFGGIFGGDGAAVRFGVEEEERLEVFFDAFADHVFPPGADLQRQTHRLLSVKRRITQKQRTPSMLCV